MAKTDLTAERVRELFDYIPDTGELIRKISHNNRVKVGDIVGSYDHYGYLQVSVDSGKYKIHRIVWLHYYGCFPIDKIDHINGDRSDNRITNLRLATAAENMQNQKVGAANTSGFIGVVKASHCINKWQAQIKCQGKNHFLGLYDSPEQAHAAYVLAKGDIHTFNPRQRY